MPDAISSEIREQLEALCRKVSVSYDLDPGIRKELYGHMEDQLLAHRNGETSLTEQDAFELVNKQFGDPALIQELFQGVYMKEITVSMGRRMVAVWMAFAVAALFSLIPLVVAKALPLSMGSWKEPIQLTLNALRFILFPWIAYQILLAWKVRIERGERVWFQTISTWRILVLLGITVLLHVIITFFTDWVLSNQPIPHPGIMQILFSLIALSGLTLLCVIWIWFCDLPPRTRGNATFATEILILVYFASSMLSRHGIWEYWKRGDWNYTLMNASTNLLVTVLFSLVCLGLYRITKRFRRHPEEPLQNA